MSETDLITIMANSGVFGRGLGDEKLKAIFDARPLILQSKDIESDLQNIKTVGPKTITQFIQCYSLWNDFEKSLPDIYQKQIAVWFKQLQDPSSFFENINLPVYNSNAVVDNDDNDEESKQIPITSMFTKIRNKPTAASRSKDGKQKKPIESKATQDEEAVIVAIDNKLEGKQLCFTKCRPGTDKELKRAILLHKGVIPKDGGKFIKSTDYLIIGAGGGDNTNKQQQALQKNPNMIVQTRDQFIAMFS